MVNEISDRMDRIIAEHGWAVQGVLPDPAAAVRAAFAYTIGLSAKGLPELALAGIDPRDANSILNAAASKLMAGAPRHDGAVLEQVVEGFDLMLRAMPKSGANKYLLGAKVRYPGFSAMALIYPDPVGRWPWDPACSEPTKTLGAFFGRLRAPKLS